MPPATLTENTPTAAKKSGKETPPREKSLIREWSDELIFVFLIVLFIKMFLVELYKIPSGSMTPTLLGGLVAHEDVNGDQKKDIVFWTDSRDALVFVDQGERYVFTRDVRVSPQQAKTWHQAGLITPQFDRILVNKLAYNFKQPERGDVVVFKVPDRIYREEAPIYIKRLVGTPGEELSFDADGGLVVAGKPVESPGFFQTQRYVPVIEPHVGGFHERPEIQYTVQQGGLRETSIRVPEGEYYVFGDNAHGSLDSRYWGGVPFEHFKGRAFMRVFPLFQIKLIK